MGHQIHHLINGAGIAGPLVFIAAEAAITLLFLPRSAGAVVAGALFGTAAGTALTWILVAPEGIKTKRQLGAWVKRGVEFARTLPPKG